MLPSALDIAKIRPTLIINNNQNYEGISPMTDLGGVLRWMNYDKKIEGWPSCVKHG